MEVQLMIEASVVGIVSIVLGFGLDFALSKLNGNHPLNTKYVKCKKCFMISPSWFLLDDS